MSWVFLAVFACVILAFFWYNSGPVVSVEEATALMDQGARIVDVRTEAEFKSGHLPGALNIPVTQIEKRVSELLPKDQPVVLYCRSGRRSQRAAILLERLGFASVHNVKTQAGWPLRPDGAGR